MKAHGRIREDNKNRTAFRKASPRHVVTFELVEDENLKRSMFNLANRVRMAGNQIAYPLKTQISQMKRTKKYRALQKDYGWHSERMKKLNVDSDEYKLLKNERDKIAKSMSTMQEEYGITFNNVRKLMEQASRDYAIHSVFGLTRAEDIWRGVEKVLFSDGKNIHTKKRTDLPVIRAKQIERGIIMKVPDKNNPYIAVDVSGVGTFQIRQDVHDFFLTDEYNAILDYLLHPDIEAQASEKFAMTGIVTPVFRPVCCSVACEMIRGRLRCFLHVTVAANPVAKFDRFGNRRHTTGKGRVGVDIGTKSVAFVSDYNVSLTNLGERNQGDIERTAKRKKYLLRKMGRSRRKTNPKRFKPDGTYIKKSHEPWIFSKTYLKYRNEYHELCRREAATRKYAGLELAHRLRSEGDELITEPKNARKLARRAKGKTERQDKLSAVKRKDGSVVMVKKCKKKKRFGKSIGRAAPAAFQDAVEKLFGEGYHIVPGNTYRASQYDPFLNQYVKKKLSERWHCIPDGRRVQRDIMSAFLLYCADNSFTFIDRTRCIKTFDRFWEMHQACINNIVSKQLHVYNSGIKTA